ncbi:MAG: hypothetical protein M3024_14970 [Candidatus Dormibacteraeota bacterium]|nr:hypothetical protein [Candidatus Dormibacteraeota bacterium]
MALRVTVDVFSGRPNPALVLQGTDEADLLARLRPGEPAAEPPRAPESFLGYRGLRFEQTETPAGGLPRTFRLLDGVLYGEGLGVRAADSGFEGWFLDPRSPLGRLQLAAGFYQQLGAERRRERPRGGDGDEDDRHEHEGGHERCECAPLYEPAWWNDAGQRQYNNNCYNYSTNYRSDTFAQPGLAAGAMYASLSCPDVLAGAVADDLIDDGDADNRCPREGHLVALVVAPGWDFHWYRKGRSGLWSHKPGGTQATNRDNSGNLIPDPRTADRGPYVDFCTFMIVMHGHIKIG